MTDDDADRTYDDCTRENDGNPHQADIPPVPEATDRDVARARDRATRRGDDPADPRDLQQASDVDLARRVRRGEQAMARGGSDSYPWAGHVNDPLRPPQGFGASRSPMDDEEGRAVAETHGEWADDHHPTTPTVPWAEGGFDRVTADEVSDGEGSTYSYGQAHWRDALGQLATRHRSLGSAASAEVDRLEREIRVREEQRARWMVQVQAHYATADAVESTAMRMDEVESKGAHRELAEAEQRMTSGRGVPARPREVRF